MGGPRRPGLDQRDAWLAAHLQATRIQLDFLVKAHELERIVLITHYGCAWYGHLLQRPPEECLGEQTSDVQKAAATLGDWYPNLSVEAYLAMRTRDWLSFHRIELRGGAGRGRYLKRGRHTECGRYLAGGPRSVPATQLPGRRRRE